MRTKTPASLSDISLRPWIFWHALVLGVFLLSLLVRGKVSIENSLFALIPHSNEEKQVLAAESAYAESSSRTVILLVSSSDFEEARAGALDLSARLAKTGAFEEVGTEAEGGIDAAEAGELLASWYASLLDPETKRELEEGQYAQVRDEALASVFGGFTVQSLSALDTDPFLLSEKESRSLLARATNLSGMGEKDGVLAAESGGKWHVMIGGRLTEDAVRLSDTRTIGRIYAEGDATKGVQVSYIGIPFHSWESARGAQRETAVITLVTMALAILLFTLTFRSLPVILLCTADIVLSTLTALLAVLGVFGGMNILTLIFGTTLIGTCIDYSLHYILHALWDGDGPSLVRRRIFRSVAVSCASTVACYVLLLFAPYRILKEVAVFSTAGLVSSFLTSLVLYPFLFSRRPLAQRGWDAGQKELFAFRLTGKGRKTAATVFALSVLLFAAFTLPKSRVFNDISQLYTPSQRLLESEKTADGVLLPFSRSAYAIVRGDSEEDVLCKEEEFVPLIADSTASGILSASLFVPSERTQEENRALVSKLYDAELEAVAGAEGIDPEGVLASFRSKEGSYLHVEDIPALSELWIGEVDGAVYGIVLLLGVKDKEGIRTAADAVDGVWYFDQARDISRELDVLTRTILVLLLAAFAVIIVMIILAYGARRSFGYAFAPLFVPVWTVGILTLAGRPIDFFATVALTLSVGLGLDYTVFVMEMQGGESGRIRNVSGFAVVLSFLTTIISFGSLAFSSFVPVGTFGLTVLIGLAGAFLYALVMKAVHR